MSTSNQLVLVTGVSGFVGSHVAAAILEAGYAVRGTVRSGKVEEIKAAPVCKKNPSTFSVVGIDDVATGDFTEALKGVSFIIHVASPLPIEGTPAENIALAKNGVSNILIQALKAGITKVLVTGSWGAAMNPEDMMTKPFMRIRSTEEDLAQASEEDLYKNEGNMMLNYLAAKIIAERTTLQFVKENPSLDLVMINPPFIFGPLQNDFPTPPRSRLTSDQHIYALIHGDTGRPLGMQLAPQFVDVRDVALAHVRALAAPHATAGKAQRYLVSSGFMLKKQAVEYLAKAHPEWKDRLPSIEGEKDIDIGSLAVLDVEKAKVELGLQQYIQWEKTLEDTAQSLIAAEKEWNV